MTTTTNPQIGASYYIYGKVDGVKRPAPLSGDAFVTRKIHAEVFVVRSEDDRKKLIRELDYLNTQGEFELRRVKR